MKTSKNRTLVFVCEHGMAKSILAVVHFNRFVGETVWDLHAVGRGTHPDHESSPQTVKGLFEDGLITTKINRGRYSIRSASHHFLRTPAEYHQQVTIERRDEVPPVSEHSEKARDEILKSIRQRLTW